MGNVPTNGALLSVFPALAAMAWSLFRSPPVPRFFDHPSLIP